MKTLTVLLLVLLSACATHRNNNNQASNDERPMTAFERAMLAQQLQQGHQMMIWEPHYIGTIPNNNYNHTITIVP